MADRVPLGGGFACMLGRRHWMEYSGQSKYNKRGGTQLLGVGPQTKRNTEAVVVYQATPTPPIM